MHFNKRLWVEISYLRSQHRYREAAVEVEYDSYTSIAKKGELSDNSTSWKAVMSA